MTSEQEKLDRLRRILTDMGSVAVAYSGGVDSSFLLKIAHDTLGAKAIAVTNVSSSFSAEEEEWALAVAEDIGVRPTIVHSKEMEDADFIRNPPDRCYHCKRAVFHEVAKIARGKGIGFIADGENADDLLSNRPGRRAAIELHVRSPLAEAGLTKMEIRSLSGQIGLRTSDKPQMACLSSRIPFNEDITEEKLRMVEEAEGFLRSLGIKQLRVRHHGTVARIEVQPQDMGTVMENRERIVGELKRIGFVYVTLDIQGFRSGSMEEALGNRSCPKS